MSSKIETVTVVREAHPYGRVVINKCDMKPEDKIWVEEAPKPARKPRATKATK